MRKVLRNSVGTQANENASAAANKASQRSEDNCCQGTPSKNVLGFRSRRPDQRGCFPVVRRGAALYEQPEPYKTGWIHGFYDCVFDDGACYRGAAPNGIGTVGAMAPEYATRLYARGYRDGTSLRRSMVTRYL